jgi:hypothetical protein
MRPEIVWILQIPCCLPQVSTKVSSFLGVTLEPITQIHREHCSVFKIRSDVIDEVFRALAKLELVTLITKGGAIKTVIPSKAKAANV